MCIAIMTFPDINILVTQLFYINDRNVTGNLLKVLQQGESASRFIIKKEYIHCFRLSCSLTSNIRRDSPYKDGEMKGKSLKM